MTETKAPCPAALQHLRPTDRAGFRVVATSAAVTTIAVWLSADGGVARWLAGQVLLGVAFVHWFVVLHECGHDTLFRSRRLNTLVGTLAGILALIPFRCWRRVHGRHHKWTGWQDLDPTTEALVPRSIPRAQRALVNACWRFWVPLFSILYRVENFWNLPRLFRMFPRASDRRAMIRDAALVLVVIAALIVWVGPSVIARSVLLALLISFSIEDLLLLSQHTHIPQHVSHGTAVSPFPAMAQAEFTRSLRLPRPVSRVLLHFDAHELHHMYPFVPGYHLRRIAWTTGNEIGGWAWVRRAKQLPGDVLLFQNRLDTGWEI
jgi:fatty acid desaturase